MVSKGTKRKPQEEGPQFEKHPDGIVLNWWLGDLNILERVHGKLPSPNHQSTPSHPPKSGLSCLLLDIQCRGLGVTWDLSLDS